MRKLEKILDALEPDVRKAFIRAIDGLRSRAKIKAVEKAVKSGSVDAIFDALGLTRAAFGDLSEAVRTVFLTVGMEQAVAAGIIFDVTNARAEQWLKNYSSTKIVELIEEQKEAVRLIALDGMRLGNNPRTTALDIVGRQGMNGKRKGGVLGLTRKQSAAVIKARAELSNPKLMPNYFQRELRNKQFDGIVQQAMAENRALRHYDIDRLLVSYQANYEKYRGDVIARTESLTAFGEARQEAVNQMVESGEVEQGDVIKRWSSTGDGRTREDHLIMHGQEKPINEPFEAPDGSLLMYPGDSSMGASAAQTIQCRCYQEIRVDFIGRAARVF